MSKENNNQIKTTFNFPFRDYQLKAVELATQCNKGQFLFPTGAGKTAMQAGTFIEHINNSPGFGVYVIVAPTIALVNQHSGNYIDHFIKERLDSAYCLVHSGTSGVAAKKAPSFHAAGLKPQRKIQPTTDASKIQDHVKSARIKKKPVVIFSTYHSMDLVKEALDNLNNIKAEVLIADEAHYATREEFNREVRDFPCKKFFSYTATARNSDNPNPNFSLFMDNVKTFGPVLSKMTPSEASKRGFVVPPSLVFFRADVTAEHSQIDDNFPLFVKEMVEKAQEVLNEDCARRGVPPAGVKMLIAAEGTSDIRKFQLSDHQAGIVEAGCNTFTIESLNTGPGTGARFNGKSVTSDSFFKHAEEKFGNYEDQCVAIHYDMLTEGIDLSGFNFFVPWRSSLRESSFAQNAGRCCRLLKEDNEKILSGAIRRDSKGFLIKEDLHKLTKPNYYIMVPELTKKQKNNSHNNQVLYEYLTDSEYEMTEISKRNVQKSSGSGELVQNETILGTETMKGDRRWVETLLSRLTIELNDANSKQEYNRAEQLEDDICRLTSAFSGGIL